MSSSLINSLARMYDPKPLHGQKSGGRKSSLNGSDKSQATSSSSSHDASLRCIESRMDSLASQMACLLNMQHIVLTRLDSLSQDVRRMDRGRAFMSEEGRGDADAGGSNGSEVAVACGELWGVVERVYERIESQGHRLEAVVKLVEGIQQVISFIGEVVKSSRLMKLVFKKPGSQYKRKGKDDKDKGKLNLKSLKPQKKRRSLETSDSLTGLVLPEQVEKLNKKNIDHSHGNNKAEDRSNGSHLESSTLILNGSAKESEDVFEDSGPEEEVELAIKSSDLNSEKTDDEEEEDKQKNKSDAEISSTTLSNFADISSKTGKTSVIKQESSDEVGDVAACSKRRVTEEDVVKDDLKKSRVEGNNDKRADGNVLETDTPKHTDSDAVNTEGREGNNDQSDVKEFFIDSSPPPPAPFDHRIVTPKPHQIAAYYSINRDEVLGGGRFGQVHKCIENSSGLRLAAKIIKAKSQKEKDVVRNEIQVMNQLNHCNLIQLYAAFESRHDVILVMEYVEGGELFDRIIDENCNLTEFDTVLFIRQICEGLQYMHRMYILHLDLKPENILCVSRATNKIKIIDFGLARRYKPREKLKVNFGTPEFLAPEVINYEFVSFPTDMWSLGVITYMLLSGLSPFLGDDDNETLNNILACQWNFEEEEFTDVSEEAKDFITRLLVKSKNWRMSATESLRHPWLSEQSLHYKLHVKKNKSRSTRPTSPEC
ncbi:LOW QUALITY PROTEIN: myosin light chain kinase 2, skeletal/cardiac muscle [Phycodurus eques]|uniref:LOW QUALITY PROTEIN: myosin light chain kinase 2, skeletal/cardiac muscle n=1 Tax=Phycodurus eques TaxID=693459 RepID=UPI002ACD6DB0|nr:LOW QUALITY PROTEIN: myosin light chain kinase 2, skeletal/cardiac muscle [Phycodurus eques]